MRCEVTAREFREACSLEPHREAAERAAALLSDQGIPAEVAAPDPLRRKDLRPGSWELRVAASQLARARAILDR